MPFCTQCGTSIGDKDQFCASCGARQTVSSTPPGKDFLGEVPPRTAALLCYIPLIGWIPAIFVLASARFRHDRETRFHAFQGLYLFVAWLMVDWVLKPFFRGAWFFSVYSFIGLAKALLFGAWIWMIVKVSQHETFKLPVLGDLAEKSVSEQR
jgi:uncharacterized membrane protein